MMNASHERHEEGRRSSVEVTRGKLLRMRSTHVETMKSNVEDAMRYIFTPKSGMMRDPTSEERSRDKLSRGAIWQNEGRRSG